MQGSITSSSTRIEATVVTEETASIAADATMAPDTTIVAVADVQSHEDLIVGTCMIASTDNDILSETRRAEPGDPVQVARSPTKENSTEEASAHIPAIATLQEIPRRHTLSQSGIRKTKQYTDGTIRTGRAAPSCASSPAEAAVSSPRWWSAFIGSGRAIANEDTGIDADGEEGTHGARKVVVDWNVVELNEKTDLVLTPISDIDMAEMFGIQVDDKDKEKHDSSLPVDGYTGHRNANEDEEELMRMAADDVDDTNDNELVCLYDKENPVIEVGKLWPSMVEFRMSFRTFAVKKEFEANSMWTDRNKFYDRCKGYDGGGNACKWYISARLQPDGRKITPILAKTPNSTAKRLKVDLEKMYPIQLQYTTVWKGKQRAMKSLYGDWANTFRMLYSFKAEVENKSPESVVEIDTEALGQSETVADEATVVLPCLEVVLPSVEHEKTETVTESALITVLPCLEVVLPSVELQTEEVEQCVPSTQSAEVQTEEVGHGQVQKLRGASGVIGKNTKSISINKLCAVEPNSGKKEKKSSGRKKQKK
ncbi:hypothetical protein D1007_28038 [Hordeum vulgare]|nr:hypothetical protein D1007_28038 [Hordeum vulgare]